MLPVEHFHFIRDIDRSERSGLGLVRHQSGIRIKMTVIRSESAARQALRPVKRVMSADVFGGPPLNAATQPLLHCQRGFGLPSSGFIHQEQIAFTAVVYSRFFTVDRHRIFE